MKLIGRFAVLLATMAFLTSVSLFLLGSFLMVWPIMRKSPRNQKLQATAEMATAAVTMIQAFGNPRGQSASTD